MKKESIILAREIFGKITQDFPEDYESIIKESIDSFDEGDLEKIYVLLTLSSLILNPILNGDLPRPEKNYLYEVRKCICTKVVELRESNKPSIGRLSPEQRKRYSDIDKDKDKIIRPNPRLIREGSIGDCPKCGSTTVKRFIWFGMSIGCIQKKCDNYYKKEL